METKFTELMGHINNVVTRIEQVEQRPPPQHEPRDDNDAAFDRDADRLRRNRIGMGGNNNRANPDSFVKPKFTIPPFAGSADPEAYLDWELTVEQKFNSHLVPAENRVRLATSEFTGFALFWWNDLCNNNAAAIPQNWNALKQRMKSRFVPPYYQRDLRLKLQTLTQGSKTVEEFYQELLIGLARCDIHEDDDETCARFFGGLNRDIQNIVDYKEWNRFNQLYHIALKAEREVQDRGETFSSFRSTNTGRTFQQRSNNANPTPPVATPSATTSEGSTFSSAPKKNGSQGVSSSRSSANIICHRCKGMGHVIKDCPSRRAYIAAPDGDGYVSASDVEDDLVLATNMAAGSGEEEVQIDSNAATAHYPSLLVQRALTAQPTHEDEKQVQRNNLFYMYAIVKGRRVLTIIDTGSCNNLVSSDLVSKLGLSTHTLSNPYHIQWFNNSGSAMVTQSARIHFSVGSYHDYADFDIVPMQACSILLGRPWEYDKDAAHHGRTNTYTFMHKDKNITLLPLSPDDVKKHFNNRTENATRPINNNEPSVANHGGIQLKGRTFIATTSASANLCDNHEAPCYTMLCRNVSFTTSPICGTLHPVAPNLLQEISAGMESRTTPIQEGEDDEDITRLDTHMPWSSPSYKSSPTRSPRSSRIQPTPLHGFDDISLIRRPIHVCLDALERGRRRRRFGSGPSSRRFVDHSV